MTEPKQTGVKSGFLFQHERIMHHYAFSISKCYSREMLDSIRRLLNECLQHTDGLYEFHRRLPQVPVAMVLPCLKLPRE